MKKLEITQISYNGSSVIDDVEPLPDTTEKGIIEDLSTRRRGLGWLICKHKKGLEVCCCCHFLVLF